MIAGVSTGAPSGPEPKSLMTLVALASTLFDQQAALEEKCMVREPQQQSITMNVPTPPQPQQQQERQPSFSPEPQTRRHSAQRNAPSPSFATKTAATKHHAKSSIRSSHQNSPSKKHSIPQNNNFQCCTREGFLSKLFSVLNDESLSHVLSWMPDGKAFTIVSSREFSKSGMVYDLFGIRKMSSFLRRLNQLGFARVRDPTDPNNLDVFRKPGFMAQTAPETERKSLAVKVGVQKRMDSPTSTLMFSPTMADEKSTNGSLNLPSPGSSVAPISPRTSSPVSVSSTEPKQARKRSNSSDSDGSTQSSWVCSTPEVSKAQGRLPSAGKGTNQANILPFASMPTSMPPSIPIYPSGGPVLLRARSESYERSPPPTSMILAKQLLPPPKPIACNKTPTATTNMISLKLSPGTFQTLKLPNLGHDSQSLSNTHEIRPPPLEFVAECVRKLVDQSQEQMPMEVEGEDRPKSPFLGDVHVRALPKLQHVRDYIRLCEAAEKEADAILSGRSLSPKKERQESESNKSPPSFPCDASVLAHVELLQGYKRRKACEVSSE